MSEYLNVAIPVHAEEWNAATYSPLVAFLPEKFDDTKATKIKAFDTEGNIHFLDSQQTPTVPVIVISENERVEYKKGSVLLKKDLISIDRKGARVMALPGEGSTCGEMPYGKMLYLTGLRSENISAIESWANGAPELRMKIYYANQSSQAQQVIYGSSSEGNLWEPSHRRDVDQNWWRFSDKLMRWDSSYGDIINFAWWEEDSGSIISIPITVKGKFLGIEFNANTTLAIKDGDDHIGEFPVDRNFCTNAEQIPFGNQSLHFILDYFDY